MTYRPYLDVAISAARAAGDLLRAEFSRPDGPRGAHAKAPADDEAEALIRERLTTAFPDVFYRGEESGSVGAPDARLCWLVDPNDGTGPFIKGYRGAAVSIALLDDGEPVLGVVYAYCAPDHAGDFFSWAKGCGPLLRNDRAVPRPPCPSVLTSRHVVMASQWADEVSEPVAELTAPARFRAMPSIAYRLALVAAGDATATVSLGGPVGWDYAAGHALLLAVGLDWVDERGEPVRYTRDGHSGVHHGFGGPPAIARDLASRAWGERWYDRPEAPPLSLVRLQPGSVVSDPAVLSRAQGCLLGQLAGDSLGSLVEFQSALEIGAQHPDGPRKLRDGGVWSTLAGQPTDDSELALSLARTLVQQGRMDPERIFESYVWWYDSDPFDIGTTTSAALGPVSRPNANSQANGALMRISPLGIFHATERDTDVEVDARLDAALTHPHPLCGEASRIFAATIAFAVREGPDPHTAFDFGRRLAAGTPFEDRFGERPPRLDGRNQGWVVFAFHNAFWHLAHATDVEEAVVHTVRGGGDTDTNAAICGALLGAVYGREELPSQWRDMVLSCRPLANTRRPRPLTFWPVDALTLAERLLL